MTPTASISIASRGASSPSVTAITPASARISLHSKVKSGFAICSRGCRNTWSTNLGSSGSRVSSFPGSWACLRGETERKTVSIPGASRAEVVISTHEDPRAELSGILEKLAECESAFTERFYEIFFQRRPDTVPLFGVYAISEREEMMRETLRSLHAWLESEAWLEANLIALGRSHAEYGVTSDMYAAYVDAMIECATELIGAEFGEAQRSSLRTALEAVVEPMRQAGEEVG